MHWLPLPPVTVSVFVVLWLPDGLVPVTVTEWVPETAWPVVARVSVDCPPAVTAPGTERRGDARRVPRSP
ncbi:hypothetical protein STENM36S_05162 [Streptomyces tendae]